MTRATTWPVNGDWYPSPERPEAHPSSVRFCLRFDGDLVHYAQFGEFRLSHERRLCTVHEWRQWVVETGCVPNDRSRPFPVVGQVWEGRRSSRTVVTATETKVTFTTDANPDYAQRTQRATFARWADAQDAMPIDDMMPVTTGEAA